MCRSATPYIYPYGFKIASFFNGKPQRDFKASLLLISASHYKYRKMTGECCIPKSMLKWLLVTQVRSAPICNISHMSSSDKVAVCMLIVPLFYIFFTKLFAVNYLCIAVFSKVVLLLSEHALSSVLSVPPPLPPKNIPVTPPGRSSSSVESSGTYWQFQFSIQKHVISFFSKNWVSVRDHLSPEYLFLALCLW